MRRLANDRGSIPVAMLVVLVGLSLSAVMSTLVIGQLKNSAFEVRRELTLSAAQAGLDAALEQIRLTPADPSGTYKGKYTAHGLSCSTLAGRVGTSNPAAYSVTTTYYDADPQGNLQNVAWAGTHQVMCAAGLGARSLPRYAVFTSTGTIVASGVTFSRTLRATYIVNITNTNISGGLLHVYRPDTTYRDLCIDAGAADPDPGDPATLETCSNGDAEQTWAYASNLQLMLVSSQTPTHPGGMCLDAGTPHVANAAVLLQLCATTTPALYQQQWSYTGVQGFAGTNTSGTAMDSYCLIVRSPNTPGSALVINTSCSGAYDNIHSFSPDKAVGAGMASAANGQLVNYNQFGRCMDVTGGKVNYGYLIAWPCKQDPNPANVSWNQRWATPALIAANDGKSTNTATGTITTTPSTTYCLTSPFSGAAGQYVQTLSCTGASNQKWTVYGKTNSYATSYQIMDSSGLCLTPRDATFSPPDWFQTVNYISKIYVEPCDGSTLQKWNADKNALNAVPLKDVAEQ